MCRNIKTLFNFEPPVTDDEIRAASLQFVRKLSGFTKPSKTNEAAFERAVEQCTELGITAFVPFISERSHLQSYSGAFVERLRRLSCSAAKQAFRPTVPSVETPIPFEALLARASSAQVLLADESGEALGDIAGTGPLMLLVGPESGLASSEEKALVDVGARKIRVSRRRLRSETAAAALVSIALASE